MSKYLIEVKNVYKTYGTKVQTDVLKDLSLNIKENSFNWLVGASGSGKTTLLNLISGLDSISKGTIIVDGTNISKMTEKESAKFRANHLGFVFQFHYLLPEFTALENVLIPLRIQKKKVNRKVKDEAIELLKSVGLGHVYTHYPKEMSGGEQQRTAIARAIVGKPKLVIADEPTGNLDSENQKQVYDLIRQIHKENGTTFLIVTHDLVEPLPGERIIAISDGEIIEDKIY